MEDARSSRANFYRLYSETRFFAVREGHETAGERRTKIFLRGAGEDGKAVINNQQPRGYRIRRYKKTPVPRHIQYGVYEKLHRGFQRNKREM
jgi:hypothetical protein